jgi:hypothetical protein
VLPCAPQPAVADELAVEMESSGEAWRWFFFCALEACMQLVRDQRWRGQDFVGFPFHHARRLMFLAHTCPVRNLESAMSKIALSHTTCTCSPMP